MGRHRAPPTSGQVTSAQDKTDVQDFVRQRQQLNVSYAQKVRRLSDVYDYGAGLAFAFNNRSSLSLYFQRLHQRHGFTTYHRRLVDEDHRQPSQRSNVESWFHVRAGFAHHARNDTWHRHDANRADVQDSLDALRARSGETPSAGRWPALF